MSWSTLSSVRTCAGESCHASFASLLDVTLRCMCLRGGSLYQCIRECGDGASEEFHRVCARAVHSVDARTGPVYQQSDYAVALLEGCTKSMRLNCGIGVHVVVSHKELCDGMTRVIPKFSAVRCGARG